jgi:hypothetical protein
MPRAREADLDPTRVHRCDRRRERQFLRRRGLSGPAPQRVEHLVLEEAQRRMLHPHDDGHGARA